MKKLMSVMLGLSLLVGTTATVFGQDPPKKEKKKGGGKKKKGEDKDNKKS